MWLGYVVVSIMGLALLAVLGTAIRFAFQRRFVIAVVIAVPACLVGYFFVSLAGPALRNVIIGDPNVQTVSEGAVQVPAEELQTLYENNTHVGMYYDKGAWNHFRESYLPNGTIRGKSGPEGNPEQWSYNGQWKIEDGQICEKYDADFSCSDIYRSGDTYQYAEGPSDDVTSWFTIAVPSTELEPSAEQLTGDALRNVIEDMTLTGRLLDADEATSFKSRFFANNHAIYTLRGGDPEKLDREEYGWFRFDGDQVCLSETLGTYQDCFAVYRSGDGLSFVLTGNAVTIMTGLPL